MSFRFEHLHFRHETFFLSFGFQWYKFDPVQLRKKSKLKNSGKHWRNFEEKIEKLLLLAHCWYVLEELKLDFYEHCHIFFPFNFLLYERVEIKGKSKSCFFFYFLGLMNLIMKSWMCTKIKGDFFFLNLHLSMTVLNEKDKDHGSREKRK